VFDITFSAAVADDLAALPAHQRSLILGRIDVQLTQDTDLSSCVDDAQLERVVVTRDGKPVALVVGVSGLDAEQLEIGTSAAFWDLIGERRRQPTLTREQLQQRLHVLPPLRSTRGQAE
jgi:antitoxin (DNA-binding transcriptional repressor) of toxin-antitoxin stability system